jgi:hypothetical protein
MARTLAGNDTLTKGKGGFGAPSRWVCCFPVPFVSSDVVAVVAEVEVEEEEVVVVEGAV